MILDLIFPPLCVHCNGKTRSSRFPLCPRCLDGLEKIPPQGRCPQCFAEKEIGVYVCQKCHAYPLGLQGCAAVFEHFGPAASLFTEWKMHKRLALAKGLAAFMALQLSELSWPQFDLIVPIAQTFLRKVSLGFNPSHLLAVELGKLLGVPVVCLLKKKMGEPLQTLLTYEKRKHLSSDAFEGKKKYHITGKTVLIVDDLIKTGATLKTAAAILKEGFPQAVYGMTLFI